MLQPKAHEAATGGGLRAPGPVAATRKNQVKQGFLRSLANGGWSPKAAHPSVASAQMMAVRCAKPAISVTPEDHFVAPLYWIRYRRRGPPRDQRSLWHSGAGIRSASFLKHKLWRIRNTG
jgi:hypothetical protein